MASWGRSETTFMFEIFYGGVEFANLINFTIGESMVLFGTVGIWLVAVIVQRWERGEEERYGRKLLIAITEQLRARHKARA